MSKQVSKLHFFYRKHSIRIYYLDLLCRFCMDDELTQYYTGTATILADLIKFKELNLLTFKVTD